jgi:hypothetical protein
MVFVLVLMLFKMVIVSILMLVPLSFENVFLMHRLFYILSVFVSMLLHQYIESPRANAGLNIFSVMNLLRHQHSTVWNFIYKRMISSFFLKFIHNCFHALFKLFIYFVPATKLAKSSVTTRLLNSIGYFFSE